MSNLYDEWLEMDNNSFEIQPAEIQTPADFGQEYMSDVNIIRENIETQPTVILLPQKSGLGSLIAGGLAVVGIAGLSFGGFYLYSENQDKASLKEDVQTDELIQNNEMTQDIRKMPVEQSNSSLATELRDTGCTRQLSAIEDIPGAFTTNGNNTDICWELGELVNRGIGVSGVVTLWGESPHAGKIDDDIMHNKFLSGDISKEELTAIFSGFVLDNIVDTELIVLDRDRENYFWNTSTGTEKVVVETYGGQ